MPGERPGLVEHTNGIADAVVEARGPRSEPAPTGGAPTSSTDPWTNGLRNLSAPRSLVQLPALVARGFAAVWQAGRWPTCALVAVSVVSAASVTGQLVAARALLRGVVSRGADGGSALSLLPWVIVVALLSVLGLVMSNASVQLRRYLGQLVTRRTSRAVLDVTARVPLTTFESQAFYDHVQRVDANALNKPLDIVNSVVNLLASSLTIIGLAAVVATTAPYLIPALALTALPVYFSNRVAARMEFAFAVEQSTLIRERHYLGTLLRSRDAAKEVRAYSLAGLLVGRWEDRYREFIHVLGRLTRRRVAYAATAALASAVVLAGAMYALVASIHDRDSLISAATALVALRLLASQLQSAAGGATILYQSRLFLDDLDSFLTRGEEISGVKSDRAVSQPHEIEFDGVGFRYPGNENFALKNVSFNLRHGEIVALVGENGSGKTTLAKLLANLFEPTKGTIRWDGVDAGEFDGDGIRARIAVVFQDFLRYDFSVAQNIAFGRADDHIDLVAVRLAAQRAGAHSFIERLPDGYDTILSKVYANGVDLSVGQWQRIALARAFYRDADVVVLDEPTSALDPRAEQALFESMRELFSGRTVVLISHRFSSVRSADRILVLDRGEIVEHGTHESLMAARGLYSELFTIQASAYLDV